MEVVINGVRFTPNVREVSKIGVAITTHNRPDTLQKALEYHLKFLPSGAKLVVVDDGSTIPAVVPDSVELIRFEQSRGIVAAKNASLVSLLDAGCEQLFLFDDDAWPISHDWEKPYIESPEVHLSYQFLDLAINIKLRDLSVLYQDEKHIAYTGQRGVMLYYHRSAIEAVGGFDPVYQRGMYEHADLALRIYHAGLTSWAFADIVGSSRLIYSLDEHMSIKRSLNRAERDQQVRRNVGIYNHRRDNEYAGFVPLRDKHHVVITSYLTAYPDPQRNKRLESNPDALSAWASSISGAKAVVMADQLLEAPKGAELVRVSESSMNIYFLRWFHVWQYLRVHPEIDKVWCTDGTDVEMLREPWDVMIEGKIYVGSEPKTYADNWAIHHHPEPQYQAFIASHTNDVMLNAGLLGGSREDVMMFAHSILRIYSNVESHNFWDKRKKPFSVGDMIAFGMVGYRHEDRLITGPSVHTVFKSNGIGREYAFWQHK
ncbi:glycosyltransferase [Pantoea sp. Al-1710]|uniref:Glycosyltransferase n=1 Tax=Candidatus Pantoea communis TaxID=2608354 RepID=A0ABX0RNR3_9GAMM|nr:MULTISPECIES: glycosyltransferase [Pantoea]NIG12994.1 glycosyltransferase [Pantoea sp. Cy-640]NIG17305.1 glycosyltransferase [Pantoea communis]